jgi:hypothetical protein
MTDTEPTMSRHRRPSAAAILVVPLVVAALVALFAWPNARLEPRDLPIGVAGPAVATTPVEAKLAAQSGAFDVHRYADAADARAAIEDRDVYGAFVVGPGGPEVLTASAASPAVAQALTHAAGELDAPVTDVVEAGPRGSALASAVLPLVLAGIVTGIAASLLSRRLRERAALVVGGSVLSGLAATAVVQSWLDVVGGDWAANAGALSLVVLAISATVAGLHALLGERGIVLGALTMILVGNPFSGVGSAPEMLPEPAGGLGALMPPGAGGNLLRSTGLFDGAGAGRFVAVLAVWAAAGLALIGVAALRERRGAPVPAPELIATT